jgi:hypothetical protein
VALLAFRNDFHHSRRHQKRAGLLWCGVNLSEEFFRPLRRSQFQRD